MIAINTYASSIAAFKKTESNSALRMEQSIAANEMRTPESRIVYTVDLAEQRAKLDQYRAEREAAMKEKYGDEPPDMIAVAMPVDVHGRTPFVTADQQKLIDEITEQYAAKGTFEGLIEALEVNGVHPEQIAAGAEYFISPGGHFTDKRGRSVNHTVDILV